MNSAISEMAKLERQSDGPPFTTVSYPEPHREQRRKVIDRHPEVGELYRPYPLTAAWILALTVMQLGLTAVSLELNWPVLFLLAYFVGAFVSHGLYVLVHDAAHGLVFKRPFPNRLMVIAANLLHVIPSGISFRTYHLMHHRAQGSYALDADLPCEWEVRLFNRLPAGHFLWLCFYPFLMVTRSERVARRGGVRSEWHWMLANALFVLAVNAGVVAIFGWKGLFYLFLSFLFAFGPHPLGARWIQEHYVIHGQQETNSYYGPLNRVAFNVGHHNEHNDFPRVPWVRLPRVRRLAPEVYDSLHPVPSYFHLWTSFIRGKVRLSDRIVREWSKGA